MFCNADENQHRWSGDDIVRQTVPNGWLVQRAITQCHQPFKNAYFIVFKTT